jgi:hypothetical protein
VASFLLFWATMLSSPLRPIRGKRTSKRAILIGLAILCMSHAVSTWGAVSVTVLWDANTETNLAGYKVHYGVASRSYGNTSDVGNITNATVSGLIEGTTYFFAVTAYDTSNLESDYSDEVFYTVPGPNRAPTLNTLGNLNINEDAPLQTVNLSGISSGAANELQTLTVSAVSSNPSLIPNPAINYTSPNAMGSLTFTPIAGANGNATITVVINDGQTTNSTITRTFTVTVNAVNDTPTLNSLSNIALDEDAGAQAVNLSGISSGAANESQTLTISAVSSNSGLIPNPSVTYTSPNVTGILTFTPIAGANGNATITVTVNDGQTTSNTITRTFTVAVNAVNDPPTLNVLSNLTINEDVGSQTVNLSGISSGAANESQTLAVTAVSSNPGLVPNPTVNYISPNATGNLTFTPVAAVNGNATITVTVNDGQAASNIITRTFTVTVNPVNDPPTLNALSNLNINENAGLQTVNLSGISSGAANESQTLSASAVSSNPGLVPNAAVSYTSPSATGSLTFTPVSGVGGSATITVTVNDGQAASNIITRAFTVTVNRLPTISGITNRLTPQGTSIAAIPFTIGDAETAVSSLTLLSVSSNPTLVANAGIVFGGTGANRTVTITPTPGNVGTANITITVGDGAATASTTFELSVQAKPSRPGNLRLTAN